MFDFVFEKKSIEKMFNQKKIGFFSSAKKNFPRKLFFDRKIFRSNIFQRKKFRSHIPILKIPKIPKITLRKLCDEAWCPKTKYIIQNHEFIVNCNGLTHRKNKCLCVCSRTLDTTKPVPLHVVHLHLNGLP